MGSVMNAATMQATVWDISSGLALRISIEGPAIASSWSEPSNGSALSSQQQR